MPLFNHGDIIHRTNEWGEQVYLVMDIRVSENTFPDSLEYYVLLIMRSPSKQTEGHTVELATSIIDKMYKLKA